MSTLLEASRAIQAALSVYQPALNSWAAYLGDGAGAVIGTQQRYYLCRYPTPESPAVEVYANGCPPVDGLRVKVGYSADQPKLIKILSWTDPALDDSQLGLVPYHANQHAYLGGDTVYVDWRQITTLRVQPYSGLSVFVNGGVLPRVGTDLYVMPQIVDLAGNVPALSGNARYALLSIDTSGAIVVTNGTLVSPIMSLDTPDVPDTPVGNFRIAAVSLAYGQTTIEEKLGRTDILDLRWPQERVAGSSSIALTDIPAGMSANQVMQTGTTPFNAQWSTNTLAITGNSTINGSLVGNVSGSGTIATGGFTLTISGTSTINGSLVGNISGGGTLATTTGQTYTFPTTGGTVPLGTGTATRVTFWSGTNTVSSDANITWTTGAGVTGLNVLGGKMMTVRGDAGDRSRFNTYISAGSVSIDAYDDVAAAYIPVTYNYGEYIRMNSNLASGYTRFDVQNNRIGVFKSTGLGIFTTFPASPIHALTDGDTAGVKSVVILDATRTSAGTAGDGGSITLRGKSSTTAAQSMGIDQWLWTDATHASRTALRRGTTTGNATNTGYYGHWNYSAVAGSAITVIPDGTGDITDIGSFLYAVAEVTGTGTGGGIVTLTPGGAAQVLYNDLTDTITITCAANGSVSVIRTAGTDTFKISLWGTWI